MNTEQATTPIREARIAAGLSMSELGRRVGVNHAHILRIETGARKASVPALHAIATELGMDALAASLKPYV